MSRQTIQDAGIGFDIAQRLGIKGGVRLRLDEVVSPVYVVGQNETPEPANPAKGYVFVPAAAANVSIAILQPSSPCFLDRISFQCPSSQTIILRSGQVSASSGIPANVTGEGIYLDDRDPFTINSGSTLLPSGINNLGALPAGTNLERRIGSTATFTFSEPIYLGPLAGGLSKRWFIVATNNVNTQLFTSWEYRLIPSGSEPNR